MEQPSPLHGAGVALVDAQPDAEAGCCDDDGVDAPTPKDTLSEAELLAEEDASVEKRRGALGLKPCSTHGLGLCFSGGGVRAASFDCGVLMKMGELGLLKEVDHLSAVSGGGYTASAYLTHLQYCEAPCPKGGKAADDWFRLRTAELVARMQDNIGYLITCAHSFNAAPGRERGSPYARCCDVPAFVALLLGMPAANVLTFVAFWALPATVWVNLNHGHSMRAKLCSKGSHYSWIPTFSLVTACVATGLWCFLKLAQPYALKRAPKHLGWLRTRACLTLCSRLALSAVVYSVLIIATMGMEVYDFGYATESNDVKCACAKFFDWSDYGWTYESYLDICDDRSTPIVAKRSFAVGCLVFFGILFAVAALFAMVVSPLLLGVVARVVGPLLGIFAISYVAQYRVFGPVTEQQFVENGLPYDATWWSVVFFVSCGAAIWHLPMQHELPRTLHRFYARSLRRAFFALGADAPLCATTCDLAGGVPPPNLILGATVNEFRRPETAHQRGQPFVLTPRAWGGKHTGYARPPRWLSLSRAMAISGAAIDGFVLTQFKSKALRLALQVLNLTMGDTIRFSVRSDDDDAAKKISPGLAFCANVAECPTDAACGTDADEVLEKHRPGSKATADMTLADHELAATLNLRTKEMVLFASVYVLFMLSAASYSKSDDKRSIYETASPIYAGVGFLIMFLAICFSVFTHGESARFLLASPIIQQAHLLMQVTSFGTRPPPFLTLTDGGLVECIGIVELFRRRCRWIVVVDTTEDPGLALNYLKESLGVATAAGLVNDDFEDRGPEPRLPVAELLSPKIADKDYARLGATYADGAAVDVFVVKMRKPRDGCAGPCRPLIHPREVAAEDCDVTVLPKQLLDLDEPTPELRLDQINGLCAESCHTACACLPCGQFPFLGVGNQFLTPIQFANLSRLANDLADAPLRALLAARGD